jgi:hypothetical protein
MSVAVQSFEHPRRLRRTTCGLARELNISASDWQSAMLPRQMSRMIVGALALAEPFHRRCIHNNAGGFEGPAN